METLDNLKLGDLTKLEPAIVIPVVIAAAIVLRRLASRIVAPRFHQLPLPVVRYCACQTADQPEFVADDDHLGDSSSRFGGSGQPE